MLDSSSIFVCIWVCVCVIDEFVVYKSSSNGQHSFIVVRLFFLFGGYFLDLDIMIENVVK